MTENQFRFFSLPTFHPATIEKNLRPAAGLQRIAIGIDCVLGLPTSLPSRWRSAVEGTLAHEGYGQKAACDYFQKLGGGQRPVRQIDVACKAQSIFQKYPFQKNIQTGTFRFWKEMALYPDWFFVPFLEGEMGRGRVPVFEGYPSLSWKILFGARKRQPEALGDLLRSFDPKLKWSASHQALVEKDPNFADSLVLTLSVREFAERELAIQVPSREGWILGASAMELMQLKEASTGETGPK